MKGYPIVGGILFIWDFKKMTLRPHFAPRNEGNSNNILVLVNLIIDKALVKLSQIIKFTRQNLSI